MRRSWLFAALILSLLFSTAVGARTKWGSGLIIGAPTVLAHVAIPAGEYLGIDIDLGWSLWDITNAGANGSSLYGILDIIAWNPEMGTPKARFAIGLGVAMGTWMQKYKNADNGFFVGMRIPLGFEWVPNEHFEGFIKLGPGVLLFPSASFRVDIGIGGRYMF